MTPNKILGRNNKQTVLKAQITDFVTGVTRTADTQEEIVAAAAESKFVVTGAILNLYAPVIWNFIVSVKRLSFLNITRLELFGIQKVKDRRSG